MQELELFITKVVPGIILTLVAFGGFVQMISALHIRKCFDVVEETEDLIDSIHYEIKQKQREQERGKTRFVDTRTAMNMLLQVQQEEACLLTGSTSLTKRYEKLLPPHFLPIVAGSSSSPPTSRRESTLTGVGAAKAPSPSTS